MDRNRIKGSRAILLKTALILLAGGFIFAGSLSAEPYFAVRDGYKCSKCHVNKTGGGKRTDYGTLYMQTRMSMYPGNSLWKDGGAAPKGGGTQNFSSRHLNEAFSVGMDLRMEYHYIDPQPGNPEKGYGRENRSETGCVACHNSTGGGGKRSEIYFQADLIPEKLLIYSQQNLAPNMNTREFFALMEGLPGDGYVKAGTFRLPTAMNRTYDDPLAHGISGGDLKYMGRRGTGVELGWEPGPYSFSLSSTDAGTPEAPTATSRQRLAFNGYVVGGAGLFGLLRMSEPTSNSDTRTTNGAYAGGSVGRFSVLIELDRMEDEETGTNPELGLAELNFLITRGQNVKLLYEYLDPDTGSKGDITDRTSLIYEPFLAPVLQMRGGVKYGVGPKDDATTNYTKYFVELHVLY